MIPRRLAAQRRVLDCKQQFVSAKHSIVRAVHAACLTKDCILRDRGTLGRNRGEDIDAWKDLQALRVWDAVDELRRHGASDRA